VKKTVSLYLDETAIRLIEKPATDRRLVDQFNLKWVCSSCVEAESLDRPTDGRLDIDGRKVCTDPLPVQAKVRDAPTGEWGKFDAVHRFDDGWLRKGDFTA
jgi:hypothetical protein